jgi:hypothetical protein
MSDPIFTPPAEVRPAADLAALAAEINAEHRAGEAAARKGMDHFRKAGAALLRAKASCRHGEWLPWLAKSCPYLNERKAQRYMALAKSDVTSDLQDQWRVISGNASAGEMREELWVREWAEEGVTPPATTGRGLREQLAAVKFPLDLPLDEPDWDRVLYKLLAEQAAAHLLRTGRMLSCPGDLHHSGWSGPHAEHNRIAAWNIYVERAAGGFLHWCDKAGVVEKRKGFCLPEQPFAGAKEALRFDLDGDVLDGDVEARAFADEEAARRLGVDLADLPRALHSYTIGHFHCFFDLKLLERI